MEKYTISFGGLHDGTHSFQFIADDEFFAQFTESPITAGILEVKVDFIKKSHLSEMLFDIRGTVKTECDRCLEQMDISISYTGSLFLKRNNTVEEEEEKEDDEIVFISLTQTDICIAQHIFEFVVLSLPLRRVHPENKKGKSTCNPEMLKKIDKLSVKETATTDGRWDDLKKLMN